MYESIRTLYNVEPPVADEEIRAAALEYVQKIGGFHKPAPANEEAVSRAVDQVAAASQALLDSLVTTSPAGRGNSRRTARTSIGCPPSGRGSRAVSTARFDSRPAEHRFGCAGFPARLHP